MEIFNRKCLDPNFRLQTGSSCVTNRLFIHGSNLLIFKFQFFVDPLVRVRPWPCFRPSGPYPIWTLWVSIFPLPRPQNCSSRPWTIIVSTRRPPMGLFWPRPRWANGWSCSAMRSIYPIWTLMVPKGSFHFYVKWWSTMGSTEVRTKCGSLWTEFNLWALATRLLTLDVNPWPTGFWGMCLSSMWTTQERCHWNKSMVRFEYFQPDQKEY